MLVKKLRGKIHDKAKPFITWLREAEEDSSEEEEEDVQVRAVQVSQVPRESST